MSLLEGILNSLSVYTLTKSLTMRYFSGAVLSLFLLLSVNAFSQDEGPAVAKARFERPNSIMVAGGISRVFNKNVGDYTRGTNAEISFLRRLNKLVSIGGFVSKSTFAYDPAKSPTTPTDKDLYKGFDLDLRIESTSNLTYRDQFVIPENYDFPHGFQLSLEGGAVSLTTVGANIKLNLIPVSDKLPVSLYVLARPFGAVSTRADVSGSGKMFLYGAKVENGQFVILDDDKWYPTRYTEDWGPDGYPALKGETVLTGGLHIGPGIEIMPSGPLSFYIQAMLGYTLPVSFVSTRSFPLTTASYTDPTFPIISKGFPALSLQAGLSYNF